MGAGVTLEVLGLPLNRVRLGMGRPSKDGLGAKRPAETAGVDVTVGWITEVGSDEPKIEWPARNCSDMDIGSEIGLE